MNIYIYKGDFSSKIQVIARVLLQWQHSLISEIEQATLQFIFVVMLYIYLSIFGVNIGVSVSKHALSKISVNFQQSNIPPKNTGKVSPQVSCRSHTRIKIVFSSLLNEKCREKRESTKNMFLINTYAYIYNMHKYKHNFLLI